LKGPHPGYDGKESEKGLHGSTIVGTEVGGSTGKLCSQGCGKISNDISQLTLYNRRAKLACGKSTYGKNSHSIASCHLKNKSLNKIAS
jgi:hypothetical protein